MFYAIDVLLDANSKKDPESKSFSNNSVLNVSDWFGVYYSYEDFLDMQTSLEYVDGGGKHRLLMLVSNDRLRAMQREKIYDFYKLENFRRLVAESELNYLGRLANSDSDIIPLRAMEEEDLIIFKVLIEAFKMGGLPEFYLNWKNNHNSDNFDKETKSPNRGLERMQIKCLDVSELNEGTIDVSLMMSLDVIIGCTFPVDYFDKEKNGLWSGLYIDDYHEKDSVEYFLSLVNEDEEVTFVEANGRLAITRTFNYFRNYYARSFTKDNTYISFLRLYNEFVELINRSNY